LPLAYGMLLRRPRDADLTRGWITPALSDRRIRVDIARFARGLDRRSLVAAEPGLRRFERPVRVVWGTADRFFTLATARRLLDTFPDAALIEVPNISTFVPIDAPDPVVDAIAGQRVVTNGDRVAG
jgi:pimeloyl-ACP methyl ester carboxylesterase